MCMSSGKDAVFSVVAPFAEKKDAECVVRLCMWAAREIADVLHQADIAANLSTAADTLVARYQIDRARLFVGGAGVHIWRAPDEEETDRHGKSRSDC